MKALSGHITMECSSGWNAVITKDELEFEARHKAVFRSLSASERYTRHTATEACSSLHI